VTEQSHISPAGSLLAYANSEQWLNWFKWKEQRMTSQKRKGGLHLFVVALLIGFAALAAMPGALQAQDRTKEGASLRFVQGSPDAPAVDVIIDGASVAQNVAYGTATEYLPLPSGDHQVQIVPTGSAASSALIDEKVSLDEGGAYIFAATGLLKDIKSKTYQIDLDNLDAGKARVRLIHLSPDAGNVDLFVAGGDKWFDNVDFPNASDYKGIDAATYDLEVRAHDSDTVAASLSGFVAKAGRAFDLIVIGQTGSNDIKVLTLVTRVSPACSDVLGTGTETDACVRFIHASAGAPSIDIYVNDSLVVKNLAFGSATDFTALPSGDDRTIKVVPTGSPIDSAIVDTKVDLDAGQAYDLSAFNRVDDIDVKTDEVNLDPVPVGQARVRMMHLATDTPDVDVVITNGAKLFGGVAYKDTTDYTTIDAGTYDVQLKDGDNVIARSTSFKVDQNMAYDVIMIGSAKDNTLEVISLAAPTYPIEGGTGTPGATAEGNATPQTGGTGVVAEATAEVVSTPVK